MSVTKQKDPVYSTMEVTTDVFMYNSFTIIIHFISSKPGVPTLRA